MKKYKAVFLLISVAAIVFVIKKGFEEKNKQLLSFAEYNNTIEEKQSEFLETEKVEETGEKDWSEKKVTWETDNYRYEFGRTDNWTKKVDYKIKKEEVNSKERKENYPKIVDETGTIKNLTELNKKLFNYIKEWEEEVIKRYGREEKKYDYMTLDNRVIWNDKESICLEIALYPWRYKEIEEESEYEGKMEIIWQERKIIYIDLLEGEIEEIEVGGNAQPVLGEEFKYGGTLLCTEEKNLEERKEDCSYKIEDYQLISENNILGRKYIWNFVLLRGEREAYQKINREIIESFSHWKEMYERGEGMEEEQIVSYYIPYQDENMISMVYENARVIPAIHDERAVYESGLYDLNSGEEIKLEDIVREKEKLGEMLDTIYKEIFFQEGDERIEEINMKEYFKNEETYEGGAFYIKEDRIGFECEYYLKRQGSDMIEIPLRILEKYKTEHPFWNYIEERRER